MRGDLDFLYHKAMRSLDWVFIDEVAALLGTNGRNDDANILYQRSEKIWDIKNDLGIFVDNKFSFLIGDSQMGENWYRNRK